MKITANNKGMRVNYPSIQLGATQTRKIVEQLVKLRGRETERLTNLSGRVTASVLHMYAIHKESTVGLRGVV